MEILYVHRGKSKGDALQKILTEKHLVRQLEGPLHKKTGRINTDNTKILVVFVNSIVNKKVLDLFPKLEMIATCSTGTDHIDLLTCKERNIKVANVPGYGAESVGELTILLLLATVRKLKEHITYAHKGDIFTKNTGGFVLNGKTIGIVGAGTIGSHVGKIAKGLGMKVIFSDIKKPKAKLLKDLDAEYAKKLSSMLPKVDILSLHIPITPETRHLISYEEIASMKKGTAIINTSRGGIIYSPALLEGIKKEHIFGAGLDVLESEQLMSAKGRIKNLQDRKIIKSNRKLIHHPRVVHTPHIGAQTEEASSYILEVTAKNILSFIKGKSKPNE